MQPITSPHNPRLKDAARLIASAHERRKSRRCVLEGEHLIEMYAARHGSPDTLIVTESYAREVSLQVHTFPAPPPCGRGRPEGAEERRRPLHAPSPPTPLPQGERGAKRSAPLVKTLALQLDEHSLLCVPDALFKSIASLPPAVGMLAIIDQPFPTTTSGAFCVLLEDVQDPGNVGSILRTAAAAGVTHAVLSKHCASAWSPKVLRAAQGAHFLLEIVEDADAREWAHDFRANGGLTVGTLAARGQNVFTSSQLQHRPLALVFGNEGVGLSDALTQLVDTAVTIPMPGNMESLNVASAAAVALFECVRQSGIRGQISDVST
ncbi:MAG: RNA methyltransferase [Proteobacteria bacterium]|nr:RNA methyltransferase [Pseudomonadota bacterium]